MKRTIIIMIAIVASTLLVAGASQAGMPTLERDAGTTISDRIFSNGNMPNVDQDGIAVQPRENIIVENPDLNSAMGLDCHIAIVGVDSQCTVEVLGVTKNDLDCDCIQDAVDNCPANYNPGQEKDGNGEPLACRDDDGDGIMNDVDNCREIYNPDQADNDGDDDNDLIGDACEDTDGDGYFDDNDDNCPYEYNTTQSDVDDDTRGDACDNCPFVSNEMQLDTDQDGQGDACSNDDDGDEVLDAVDNCPTRYNPDQDDLDGDAWGDICDNCMDTYNPDQADDDENSIGDACEGNGAAASITPINTWGDGGCSLGMNVGGNPLSLLILALALVPAIITRWKI